MPRSSTTGLPFLVRRTDTGKFCYHREMPATVASFVTGEVELPWKERIHKLEGRPTVKVSLATGDEAMARVRWNRVHEQVEGLVQMGQVLAAGKQRQDRQRQTVDRLPDGAVATIAAQARHDLLAEHDECLIDPSFTSPLTGVAVRLMREAGRAASSESVDEARRFADAVRLSGAKASLASRRLGMLDIGIEEAEVTDPQLAAALHDLAAGRIARLTPEQNAALDAMTATSVIPSELDARLAENGFALPQSHPDRRALGLALLRTTVQGLKAVKARDAGAAVDTPERPAVMVSPMARSAASDKPTMRERWRKDVRPKDKQDEDNALYVEYFIGAFGDLPVDRITKPLLAEFLDLLQRCPRNVPHAIRHASLSDRIAWGEKRANLRVRRLARRTVNAKGLGSISAALAIAERLGHIAADPCPRMGLPITEADVVRREPYSLRDLKRIFKVAPFRWFLLTLRGSCGQDRAALEQIEGRSAVALALDELQPRGGYNLEADRDLTLQAEATDITSRQMRISGRQARAPDHDLADHHPEAVGSPRTPRRAGVPCSRRDVREAAPCRFASAVTLDGCDDFREPGRASFPEERMSQTTETLPQIDSRSDDEMLETVANDHYRVGAPEVGVPEMRSLAAKMMKHPDREVREIAVSIERCVERPETGR